MEFKINDENQVLNVKNKERRIGIFNKRRFFRKASRGTQGGRW